MLLCAVRYKHFSCYLYQLLEDETDTGRVIHKPQLTGRLRRYCGRSVNYLLGVREREGLSLSQTKQNIRVKQLRHSETENIHMSSFSDQAAASESQKFRELLGLGVEKMVEPKAVEQTVRQHFLRNKTMMSSFSK